MNAQPLRPMPLWMSSLLFGVPCLLEAWVMFGLMPFLDRRGLSPLGLYAVFMGPTVLLFLAAFVGYRWEGRPLTWEGLRDRFRLGSMGRADWAWSLGLTVFFIGSYVALIPTAEFLVKYTPNPKVLDKVLGDPASFAGFPLKGSWWLLGVFFIGYFFNVMGEELFWRGYILPRQVETHGPRAWIVHGLQWTLFHLFFAYDILMLLPGALALSWVCQRRSSTWPGVVAHGLLNALAAIRIVKGILA